MIQGKDRRQVNNKTGLRLALYADGAEIEDLLSVYRLGLADGITTNPTLMAKAGVRNYRDFAQAILEGIPDLPISFEVISDDIEEMGRQAREIASWGPNVFVKIPISNTRGESTVPLIRRLCAEGVQVNATAVLTMDQVEGVIDAVAEEVPAIISVFAGRIADTGRDPMPVMREVVRLAARKPSLRFLWASPREVLNIYQAEACGCHLIAVTPELIAKLSLRDKDLAEFSRETVQMFYDDACRAGYQL
jgi:transaldolase